MCCVSYWPRVSTSHLSLALVWGLSGEAGSYQQIATTGAVHVDFWPSPLSLGRAVSREGVRVCQAIGVAPALPDTEHNTSLSHSSTRCSFQPLLMHEMVMCGNRHLLWRSCGFSLLLLQFLNPGRKSTAWLTFGLKNVILHLRVSNHPDPKSQSFF